MTCENCDYLRAELARVTRERDNLKADFESLECDAARVVRALDELPVDLRAAAEMLRDNGRNGWWVGKSALNRLRVDASGLAPSTVSTAIGLVNAELRARKAELRGCTDLARRKRLVARIETLRAALSDLDAVAMAANALRRADP